MSMSGRSGTSDLWRSGKALGEDGPVELRRSRRANRVDAQGARRRTPLDRRRAFPACPQLLHAPAGPEAQQLAIYIGWLLHRTVGGLVAGLLFILPGALVMRGLSIFYVLYSDAPIIAALFFGSRRRCSPCVSEAVIRIGRRALKSRIMVGTAVLAFLAIYVLNTPFPLIILAAGIAGWIGHRIAPSSFSGASHGKGKAAAFKGAVDLMFERGELRGPAGRSGRGPAAGWRRRTALPARGRGGDCRSGQAECVRE